MDHHYQCPLNPTYSELMLLEGNSPVCSQNKMAGGAVFINENTQIGVVAPTCFPLPAPRCSTGIASLPQPQQPQQQHQPQLHPQHMQMMVPQAVMHPQPFADHYGHMGDTLDDRAFFGGGAVMHPGGLPMPAVGYPAPPNTATAMMVPEAAVAEAVWNSEDNHYTEMQTRDHHFHQAVGLAVSTEAAEAAAAAAERRRRERRRELNRVAATRCRERKLQRICSLQERVHLLRGDTDRLAQAARDLRAQVRAGRAEVLAHARAGCMVSLPPSSLPEAVLGSPLDEEESFCDNTEGQWPPDDDAGMY